MNIKDQLDIEKKAAEEKIHAILVEFAKNTGFYPSGIDVNVIQTTYLSSSSKEYRFGMGPNIKLIIND